MGFFKGRKGSIPAWASYFTEKEYDAFIAALDDHIHNTLSLDYEMHDGVIQLTEDEYELGQLGLDNVARTCKQNKAEEYPEIIASHFNSMMENAKFQREFEKIENDFEQVKNYIAVRLYDAGYMSYAGKDFFISREFAGELSAVLVFDLPHAVTNIKPEQMAPWGKSVDELFETGLMNVRRNYEINAEAVEFSPEKDMVHVCEASHLFAANVLFELDTRAGFLGKGGCLAAAPSRNVALIYPINDLRVVNVASRMCTVVQDIYRSDPGSLTAEIYWYRNGRFTPLPYAIEKKKIRFAPPEEFVELLNSFAN